MGKKVRPVTFGMIKVGKREYRKSPANKHVLWSVAIIADPTKYISLHVYKNKAIYNIYILYIYIYIYICFIYLFICLYILAYQGSAACPFQSFLRAQPLRDRGRFWAVGLTTTTKNKNNNNNNNNDITATNNNRGSYY